MATEYTDFNALKRLTAGMSEKEKFQQIQLALPGADFKSSYYVHKPLGDRVFPHLVEDESEISRLQALDWSRAEVVQSEDASGRERSHASRGGGQIYNERTAGSITEQMTLPDGTVVERKRPHPDEIIRRAVAVQRQRPAGSPPPKSKGATIEQRTTAAPSPTPPQPKPLVTVRQKPKKKGKNDPTVRVKQGKSFIQYRRVGKSLVRA